MPRKKSQIIALPTSDDVFKMYAAKIETDPQYSLEVDPESKYGVTDKEKRFIKNYIEFRSIPVAAQLSDISLSEAKQIYGTYAFKQEVDRITKAKLYRRFTSPVLSIKSIAGYLSSIITEDNLSEVEKVSTMDKVRIAQILIELNFTIADIEAHDNVIDVDDLDKQIKSLSVNSIKTLLKSIEQSKDNADMTKAAIDLINEDGHLSPDEIAYLNSLSSSELLKIVEQIISRKK